MMRNHLALIWLLLISLPATADPLREQALASLSKSISFCHSISTQGGYLWRYSPDLSQRFGEGKATATQIWVQPPGTPAVGQAFLRAYQVTANRDHLNFAREAALALSYGQLDSGGWDYRIDFDPTARRRNNTVLDDDNTQSAIRFLLALSAQTKESADPRDLKILQTLDRALAGLLKARYPNGAFPQVFNNQPRERADLPIIKATVPADPATLPRIKEYWHFYTLNDHCLRTCISTLLLAHEITRDARYLSAAKKAGDFILLAQLPDPHPAWSQQYDFQMRPAWARKFEPPAVCSSESVGVMHSLIDLQQATGDAKYLEPIPRALAWLDKVKLPSGKHARFYELGTNLPLYFTKDYRLVYSDNDVPTHYSFQGDYNVDALKSRLAKLKDPPRAKKADLAALEGRARQIIDSLDEKGRWLKDGQIDSATFIRNVDALCDYLEAAQQP